MNLTDTNQASEDKSLMNEIDLIFGTRGMMQEQMKAAIQALIRTEKLKLLAAVRELVIGEDEITYANYEDGFFGGKKVTRDKLRESQRIELTKLEAEL